MDYTINKTLNKYILYLFAIPSRVKRQYYLNIVLPKMFQENKAAWESLSHPDFIELRRSTLQFIISNQKVDTCLGSYSFKPGGPELLYASCFAALTRHLYGDLISLSSSQQGEWIAYLQKYQDEDGLFRDPAIDIPLAEMCDSWGWRHLTLHVLMALDALGGVAQKPFRILNHFKKPGQMAEWLETRKWKIDPANVSNEVQNYATMLQYARDFQNESWCRDALDEMYLWLDRHQDPKTGLWGNGFDTPRLLSLGVQTGYHLWLLYFYDRRPIQYVERIIDSCLATQNRLGGFGVSLNSSACEDIDSIDPLARFYLRTDYRRDDIHKALEKALPWVLFNSKPDGGWVFRRGEALIFGDNLMSSQPEESSLFPAWFRSLSLAYLGKVLVEKAIAKIEWQFLHAPGLQFWSDSPSHDDSGSLL